MTQSTIKFAMINFKDTPFKDYCFLTDIKTLKIGDLVVVETIRGFNVGKFIGYVSHFPVDLKKAQWVVQKVDLTKHNTRSVADVYELQRMLKKQTLTSQINELLEKANELKLELAEL